MAITYVQPEGFNPNIAFIEQPDLTDATTLYRFQVINETGDDWDEAATRKAYYAWIEAHPDKVGQASASTIASVSANA